MRATSINHNSRCVGWRTLPSPKVGPHQGLPRILSPLAFTVSLYAPKSHLPNSRATNQITSRDTIQVPLKLDLDNPPSVPESKVLTIHAFTAKFPPAQVLAALCIPQYAESHLTAIEGIDFPQLFTSWPKSATAGGLYMIGACHTAREDEGLDSAQQVNNRIFNLVSTDHRRGKVWSRRRRSRV
jgi:hypothetical protein